MTDIDSSQKDTGSGGYRNVQKNGEHAEAESPSPNPGHSTTGPSSRWPMQSGEYERYARQMIVPGVGLQGQLHLRSAKVLIIGAGGLGCPAATYLAGAGVGTLGIVDGDTVEVSNLHRQIGHATSRVGMKKTESLIIYLRGLNPLVRYVAHSEHVRPDNAERILSQYDVILDCTDRPPGRYLISDVCVLLQKPLVTAAALRTDGQLIVLNTPPTPAGSTFGSPCYRCVWKNPPPPETNMTCGEFGVLGPTVGIMGTMQANETIKLITAGKHIPIPAPEKPTEPSLLIFADWRGFGLDRSAIRSVPMKKKPGCIACGPSQTITLQGIASGTPNYDDFCGLNSVVTGAEIPLANRISPRQYRELRDSQPGHLLLDVREPEHFSISALPGAVNVRYRDVSRWLAAYETGPTAPRPEAKMPWEEEQYDGKNIWVVCRTGLDSRDTVSKMLAKGLDKQGTIKIGEIAGGMKAWQEDIDHTMPFV